MWPALLLVVVAAAAALGYLAYVLLQVETMDDRLKRALGEQQTRLVAVRATLVQEPPKSLLNAGDPRSRPGETNAAIRAVLSDRWSATVRDLQVSADLARGLDPYIPDYPLISRRPPRPGLDALRDKLVSRMELAAEEVGKIHFAEVRTDDRGAEFSRQRESVIRRLNDLQENASDAVSRLLERRAGPAKLHTATQQLVLLERIGRSAAELGVLVSSKAKASAVRSVADRAGRDAAQFGKVNNALLAGDRQLGIERVYDETARGFLELAGRDFRGLAVDLDYLFTLARDPGDDPPGLAFDSTAALAALAEVGDALAAMGRAHRAQVAARWLDWSRLQWAAIAVGLVFVGWLYAMIRDGGLLRRDHQSRRALAAKLEAQVRSLLDQQRSLAESSRRSASASASAIWQFSEGNFARASAGEHLDPGVASALDSLAARLESGMAELGTAANNVRGATGLLGEAARDLEALNSDAVHGLGNACTVGAVLRDGAARLASGVVGMGESNRAGTQSAGRGMEALADLEEHLTRAAAGVSELEQVADALGDSIGGFESLTSLGDELSEHARLLTLRAYSDSRRADESPAAMEALTPLVERANALGRVARSLRDSLQTEARAVRQALNEAAVGLGQAERRAARARSALAEVLERSRRGQRPIEHCAVITREQQAELRRQVLTLTDLAARVEKGRGEASRIAGAASRLNELSYTLERRALDVGRSQPGLGTVVHIRPDSGRDSGRSEGEAGSLDHDRQGGASHRGGEG